jgi:hypothetical protein
MRFFNKPASWRRAVVAIAVCGFVVASCGSDSGSSGGSGSGDTSAASTTAASGSETTAAPATGAPIKVMTVTTLNAAGPTYENISVTAKLYADYINAKGGINGHPLEVTV